MRTLKVYIVDTLEGSKFHAGTLECYDKYCYSISNQISFPLNHYKCKHYVNWGQGNDKTAFIYCARPNSVRFIEDEE